MDLIGKVALVTGASRGIGRGIAIELANLGCEVIINYSKDETGAKETLRLAKGKGRIYKCNIGDFNEVHTMIDSFSKIDILVNNAGISKVGLLMDMTEEEWDEIININLKGIFNCCHAVIPKMLSEEKGSIINISSIWGSVGASCESAYSASKGGANTFTMALGKELGASGIRVNAICPGVIETEMNSFLAPEEKKQLETEIPMMKFGKVEDVAKLVAFLASDAAKYITAQVIKVDGGML